MLGRYLNSYAFDPDPYFRFVPVFVSRVTVGMVVNGCESSSLLSDFVKV
jgi:hypothetical protein